MKLLHHSAFSTKIGQKLILNFIIIGLIPVVFFTYFITVNFKNLIVDNAKIELRNYSKIIGGKIFQNLREQKKELNIIASSPSLTDLIVKQDKTGIESYFRKTLREYPGFSGFSALRPDGSVLCQTAITAVNYDIKKEYYPLKGAVTVTRESSEDIPQLMLYTPIFSEADRLTGILLGEVNQAILWDITKTMYHPVGSNIYIYDLAGKLLVQSVMFESSKPPFSKEQFNNLLTGTSGVMEQRSQVLGDVYCGYNVVFMKGQFGTDDWVVVITRNVDDVIDFILLLMKYFTIISSLSLLILVFAALAITDKIIKPIEHLVDSIRQITGGNLNVSVAVSGNDEIGFLGHAFNDMVTNLRNTTVSLKEKEILLREIYHRVKNNMQVFSSLTRIQSRHVKDKRDKELFNEFQDRIYAMSLVHEKLYRSKDLINIDFKEYTLEIIKSLASSYITAKKIDFNINIDRLFINLDIAIPLGLIINELLTNSLKHAFTDKPDGRIDIRLTVSGEQDVELIVADNGRGIPADIDIKKTQSLGLQLATVLIEEQLKGTISLIADTGSRFIIRFNVRDRNVWKT